MFKKRDRFTFSTPVPKNAFHSSLFVLKFEKNKDTAHTAIVASKKIDRRSVARNKVKRKLFYVLGGTVLPKADLVFFLKNQLFQQIF